MRKEKEGPRKVSEAEYDFFVFFLTIFMDIYFLQQNVYSGIGRLADAYFSPR